MIQHILVNESENIFTLNINSKIITIKPKEEFLLNERNRKNILKNLQNIKGLKITTKQSENIEENKKIVKKSKKKPEN